MQLLSHLDTTPRSTEELARKSGLPRDEVRRVFEGFLRAEWVERQVQIQAQSRLALVYEPDPQSASLVRAVLADPDNSWSGHVVRDHFGLQLLLKRRKPDAILIAVEGDQQLDLPEKLRQSDLAVISETAGLIAPAGSTIPLTESLADSIVLRRPFSRADLIRTLDQISAQSQATSAAGLPDSVVRSARASSPSPVGVI